MANSARADEASIRLDKAYKLRLHGISLQERSRLDAMHMAWAGYRDALCAYRYPHETDRTACIARMKNSEAAQLDDSARTGGTTDWKDGKLGYLSQFVGTYRYAAILDEPLVAHALEALAGTQVAAQIARNMAVMSPISMIDMHLVLTGNAPHEGMTEGATVWVNIYDGTVRAALLHSGRLTIYAPDQEYRYIPGLLRQFVRPRAPFLAPDETGPPPDVEWIR